MSQEPVVEVVKAYDTGLITIVIGGTISIIGALSAAAVLIIKEFRAGKEEIKQEEVIKSEKLDRIELLVDGRYGQVLQELADVKRLLASESGKPIDLSKADDAQTKADEQNARVTAANIAAPKK